MEEDIELNAIDLVCFSAFFALMALALIYSRQTPPSKEKPSLNWIGLTISLSATNLGCEFIVSVAGAAAHYGFSMGWFELGSALCFFVLGFILVPVLIRAKLSGVPEYVEGRFGKQSRRLLVFLTILLYITTKLSISLAACALFLRALFPNTLLVWLIIPAHVLCSAIYSSVLAAPQRAVFIEAFQLVTILLSTSFVSHFALTSVGGWGKLTELNSTYAFQLDLFRPWDDAIQPWPAATSAFYAFAIWFWALDQHVLDRALSAKDINQATTGCIAAGLLKLVPFFLTVIPGICARILLLEQAKAGAEVVGLENAYAYLLKNVVPLGLRGITIAALLFGSISSLSSAMNSSLRLLVGSLRAHSKSLPVMVVEDVRAARYGVMGMLALSLFWLFAFKEHYEQHHRLFISMQVPLACLAPPITITVLGGMFSDKFTERGCESALLVGLLLGCLLLLIEMKSSHDYFMYIAMLQSAIAILILHVVSSANDKNARVDELLLWEWNIRQDILQPRFRYTALVNANLDLEVVDDDESSSSISEGENDEDDEEEGRVRSGDCLVCSKQFGRCAIRRARVETLIKFLFMFALMRWASLVFFLQYGMATLNAALQE